MTRGRTTAVIAFLASAWCASSAHVGAQQTPPPRDARPAAPAAPVNQPVGTAAIGGIVTNDDGSKPVKFAYVMLIAPATGAAKVSQTDSDGRFVFANLPADRYTVAVTKPPYLGTVAGARRPGRPGTPIAVADGQKVTNIAIRMPMGAAITGLIVDDKGQPVANVSVSAYQWRMQNGERVPVATNTSASTDDRGRYRLFGLIPGDYLVAAVSGNIPPTPRVLSAADVDGAIRNESAPPNQPVSAVARYAGVLFPGTARTQDAVTITLAAGEERGNVDMRLQLTRAARVEGVVTSSDGQLPQRLLVSMRTKGASISRQLNSVSAQPDGTFAFSAILPDTYYLYVSAGGQPPQFATATIEVAGADITGLQLALRPGSAIAGSSVFHGATQPSALGGWRLQLRALGNAQQPSAVVSSADDSGGFTVQNVYPGSYVIGGPFGPTQDTATWTIESVVADGRDVTDRPIDITTDSAPRNLVVTITDRSQELTGRIMRASGAPAPEYTVVLFPEDKTYWISGSRRILTARPGTDGKFLLSGAGPTTLPAGRYLLAAVTDLDRDEQFDPGFLGALVPAAVQVTLQPGEKKVQDLRVK